MKKLGRWTKEHLTIHRRSPSQSIFRAPSAEPPVHPQGISTNHCPWIRIDPLVKSLILHPCHLVSHTHNVAVSLSYVGCHQDTHRALQIQIHETKSQVDWMKQIWTLNTIGCHQDTHRALQIQIHEATPRVDRMEKIGTLRMRKIRVSPCSNLPDII
jgi:hypothetical protein